MILDIIISVIVAFAILVIAYIIYLFASNKRIPQDFSLGIYKIRNKKNTRVNNQKSFSIITYNIGFGAYLKDYSFFMDGGRYSRAYSKESVIHTINSISELLEKQKADFYYLQEVDFKSTRAYKVDEVALLRGAAAFSEYDSTLAVNYDSPYLFYPLVKPHGKTKAGLLTFSAYPIKEAIRKSLPIQKGLAKFIDLDRCYSINRVDIGKGDKYLCLYHLHLSAYATDPELANKQLLMLYEDMKRDYEKGNFVIAGGDFNKDLLGDSGKVFVSDGKKHSGATAFPFDTIPAGFSLAVPEGLPTCRNAHEPYVKNSTYVQTIDGFLVSDNINTEEINVIDTEFEFSDHNPVAMKFTIIN